MAFVYGLGSWQDAKNVYGRSTQDAGRRITVIPVGATVASALCGKTVVDKRALERKVEQVI